MGHFVIRLALSNDTVIDDNDKLCLYARWLQIHHPAGVFCALVLMSTAAAAAIEGSE